MTSEPVAPIVRLDEPVWPVAEGHPLLFLVEASTRLERRILEDWIERRRPADLEPGAVQVVQLPPSRRRRRRGNRFSVNGHLEAFLRAGDDPLLIPLRVAWFPEERDGQRTVGWRDLLTFGDPRDPDPLRQHVILRANPDRIRVIAGEPALASLLEERWGDPTVHGRVDGTPLEDYVALQAWLSLERAERRLRGSRYKVPKLVREDLFTRRSFSLGIARQSREDGEPFEKTAGRALRYLKEMTATHSPYVIDLTAAAISWLIDKAYSGLEYDRETLADLYSLGERHPLVFLPSHRSNFDHLVLQYVLYENELPPNHTAGGINMNFFPIGPLIRRTGVFFIRRSFKDNELYKFVLRQYISYLIEKRFPLEWYIEGGRSRTGKLRGPRLGMLSYVAQAYAGGAADDVVLIPVSIVYDQIQDVGSYSAEQTGGGKERESFGWVLRAVRSLRTSHGTIHLRFGEPLSMQAALGDNPSLDTAEDRLAVKKLAFQVSARINDATAVTPISLVTLALLTTRDRALTVDEIMERLAPFRRYLRSRGLPVTDQTFFDSPERVQQALDDLARNGVVARFEGETEIVYEIGPGHRLAAAYYRNTIIHFFLVTAITELALLRAARRDVADPENEFWDECYRLRDLLKFEFYFSSRDDFRTEVTAELQRHDDEWERHLAAGDVHDLLASFRPFLSHAVLRPFLEAYRVVANVIQNSPIDDVPDEKALVKRALALGKQYQLQRRIFSEESVSNVLFGTALQLATHRKLLAPGPDLERRRRQFAVQMEDIVDRFGSIDAIDAGRDAGLL
jgi:glycerol-3-phosphate O-acyltransferase